MLRNFRAKGANVFVWILMGLLILGLMGFGVQSFSGVSSSAVASVGDVEITVDDYARRLQSEMRRASQSTGKAFSLADAKQTGMTTQVMNQLLQGAAIDNQAVQLGISVGDETVAKTLQKNRAFESLTGGFDKTTYENALENAGISPTEYEKNIRIDDTRGIFAAFVSNGVKANKTGIDTILNHIGETRDFTWTKFDPDTIEYQGDAPTDTQLKPHYEANSDQFKVDATRKITYVSLTPDQMSGQIEISDEEVKALYDQNIAKYQRPELRNLNRMVFPDEESAKVALTRLNADEISWDDLAAERKLTIEDTYLDDVRAEKLSTEARAGIFNATAEPGLYGPYKTDLGPAIYLLNAVRDAVNTPLADVKDTLKAELGSAKARTSISDLLAEIDELIVGGATLEDVANETPMILGEIDIRPDTKDGIAAYEGFRGAAMGASEDDYPQLTDLSDGGIFALRLNEIEPSFLPQFEDVKDAVTISYIRNQKTHMLSEQSMDIKAQLEEGGIFLKLVPDAFEEKDTARSQYTEDAPADLLTKTYEAKPNEIFEITQDGIIYLAQLIKINSFDENDTEEAITVRDFLTRQSDQEYTLDISEAFAKSIQQSAGIQLNQGVINGIHSQLQ